MKSNHSERKKTHYLVGILACALVIASAVLFLNKKGPSSETNNENPSSNSTETCDKIICDIVGPVKSFEITGILYDALLAPEIAVFNREGKLTELNSYVFEYNKDGKCINIKGKDQLKIKNYSINSDGLITQIIMHDYSIPIPEELDESITCTYDVNNKNRLQYISYQGPDGGTEGNLEYDANNHLIEFSNSAYHEIIEYNYTKFDDYGNWIERSVVYDSKAEMEGDIDIHEEYTETRIIEYYQKKQESMEDNKNKYCPKCSNMLPISATYSNKCGDKMPAMESVMTKKNEHEINQIPASAELHTVFEPTPRTEKAMYVSEQVT